MKRVLVALAASVAVMAQAQYTAREWPEGPMKQRFVEVCGACHDINRIRVGYTPEGWLTVVRMMQNFDTPVPAVEWGAMQDYLIKNFPRARPPAGGHRRWTRQGEHPPVGRPDPGLAPA